MFRFITNLFPIKAKSLSEFTDLVKQNKCPSVTISPTLDDGGTRDTASVGAIGTFRYLLDFSSKIPDGKIIVFEEKSSERFGSEQGLADAMERGSQMVQLFLLAEKRMKGLLAQIPNLSVQVGRVGEKPMSTGEFRKFHRYERILRTAAKIPKMAL